MIVHIPQEEVRLIRRQLLSDVVYAITHDALKQKNPERTELTPVEIYMSAQNFVKIISQLSDVEEGLDDEIDDLIQEAASEYEAMFIMLLASVMFQAVDTKSPTQQTHDIIMHIFQRCQDNELFNPLLMQFANKEEERYAAGKIADLMNYELKVIQRDNEGVEAVRTIIHNFMLNAGNTDKDTIKDAIVLLAQFNMDNNHILDDELKQLYEKLGFKSTTIVQIQELVQLKHVQNEVSVNAAGATGIVNNNKQQ